jgi:hypothetical protein
VHSVPSEWEERNILNITSKREIYLKKHKIYNVIIYRSDEFKNFIKNTIILKEC